MYERRGVDRELVDRREAGPEASEPRVISVVALTLLPAPPLPVVMYCCDGFTDGCGSTMVYCGADIVAV